MLYDIWCKTSIYNYTFVMEHKISFLSKSNSNSLSLSFSFSFSLFFSNHLTVSTFHSTTRHLLFICFKDHGSYKIVRIHYCQNRNLVTIIKFQVNKHTYIAYVSWVFQKLFHSFAATNLKWYCVLLWMILFLDDPARKMHYYKTIWFHLSDVNMPKEHARNSNYGFFMWDICRQWF